MTFHKEFSIITLTVLETPHVLVGAAIASKIPNPWVALPLALGSHFILELIPHWNPHLNTEIKKYGHVTKTSKVVVILDSTMALVSGGFIAYQALPNTAHATTILLACFFSVLPDVVEAPYFFLGFKNKWINHWIKIQKSIQEDAGVIPGVATQFATIIASFWWIFG